MSFRPLTPDRAAQAMREAEDAEVLGITEPAPKAIHNPTPWVLAAFIAPYVAFAVPWLIWWFTQ